MKSADTEVTDELRFRDQVERWGKPARLALGEIRLASSKNGAKSATKTKAGDTAKVEVRLVDYAGPLRLDARQAVRFDLAGAGELIDNQGTARGSRKVELANGRARTRFVAAPARAW